MKNNQEIQYTASICRAMLPPLDPKKDSSYEEIWIGISTNTGEKVLQAPTKKTAIENLEKKGYKVTLVLNDWN